MNHQAQEQVMKVLRMMAVFGSFALFSFVSSDAQQVT